MRTVIYLITMFFAVSAHSQSFNYPPYGWYQWKSTVTSSAALPTTGNVAGDARIDLTTFDVWIWNGSEWIQATSGGGSPISGSGTANTVAKWTGTSTLGNSSITDNGTTVATAENFSAAGATFSGLVTAANLTAIGLSSSEAVFTNVGGELMSNPITGSGNVVMSNSATLVAPSLGTPSALVGTNITGTASGFTAGTVTTNANLTGPITSSGNATSVASQTGTGSTFVMNTGPTISTTTLAGVTTCSSTTNATSPTAAGTLISGGLGIVKDIWMAGSQTTGAGVTTTPTIAYIHANSATVSIPNASTQTYVIDSSTGSAEVFVSERSDGVSCIYNIDLASHHTLINDSSGVTCSAIANTASLLSLGYDGNGTITIYNNLGSTKAVRIMIVGTE